MNTFDIGIVGGGLVGSLAAQRLSQMGFSVALFDPAVPAPLKKMPELRVSAITPASWQLLEQAGVTSHLDPKRLSKILSMEIFEDPDTPLHFYASEIGQEQLGFIIENNVLLQAIQAERNAQLHHFPTMIEDIQTGPDHVTLKPQDSESIQVKFLILAQGGNARLAQKLGTQYQTFDYQEEAIVCHAESEKPHGHTAYQRFLPKPLAFLPLFNPHWSSIVWTLSRSDAQHFKTNPELLIQKLTEAFPNLGKLKLLSQVTSFPMYADNATPVAGQRFVLLGDAAHVVHPLAGQGVNIGFRDVAALVKILQNCKPDQLNDPAITDAYSKATLKHNKCLSKGFSLIHYFYEAPTLSPLRKLGAQYLNRFIPLKRELIKFAIGERFKP